MTLPVGRRENDMPGGSPVRSWKRSSSLGRLIVGGGGSGRVPALSSRIESIGCSSTSLHFGRPGTELTLTQVEISLFSFQPRPIFNARQEDFKVPTNTYYHGKKENFDRNWSWQEHVATSCFQYTLQDTRWGNYFGQCIHPILKEH